MSQIAALLWILLLVVTCDPEGVGEIAAKVEKGYNTELEIEVSNE